MSDTSATQMRHEQHECYLNDTSATQTTRVKNFDLDNDTSEIIFSHPYISFLGNKRLQREEQFHSKNYPLEITLCRDKMCLESAPQNLNFVMAKTLLKSYILDCNYKCPCM